MSDMLERFNNSNKPRPVLSKQIPNLAVNYVDVTNTFQEGFTTQQKIGDPTKWTPKSLNYYEEEVRTIMIPDGFSPVELGATFNQWGPSKKYYNPGQGQG